VLGVGGSGPIGARPIETRAEMGTLVGGPVGATGTLDPALPPLQPTDERDAWAVIAGVRGIGPVGFSALLRRYGSGLGILREASSPGGIARIATLTYDGTDADDGRRHRGLDL
jgi:hypothetical protein